MSKLFNLFGIFTILLIAYAFSSDKKNISWRTVGVALLIQSGFAFFVLYTVTGQSILLSISSGFESIINNAKVGVNFVFGSLTDKKVHGFVFAIHLLPLIIAIAALISVLYYLGIMQMFIKVIGGFLSKLLGTTPNESLVAASNIFLAFTDSPMVVKPYLKYMREDELFTIMVCGLASVAGTIIVGYSELGMDLRYLVAAAFMSAPSGLLMAKIIIPANPETIKKQIEAELAQNEKENFDSNKSKNLLDAIMSGANIGLKIALSIGAMLIAFIGLIAIFNALISSIGSMFGYDKLSLELILGYIFIPIAWLLGTPKHELLPVASLIGQKIITNEFMAYIEFAKIKDSLSASTQASITFALCGFANIGSLAGMLGALNSLAPTRKDTFSKLAMKSLLAATLANLLSGAIAGFIVSLQ